MTAKTYSGGSRHVGIHSTAVKPNNNQWYATQQKVFPQNLETLVTHGAHTGRTESHWQKKKKKIEIQIRVKPRQSSNDTDLMAAHPWTDGRQTCCLWTVPSSPFLTVSATPNEHLSPGSGRDFLKFRRLTSSPSNFTNGQVHIRAKNTVKANHIITANN